jgi:hypothetical protein
MNSFFVSELAQQAKSSLFNVSHWGPFCDVTLTLKQARQADNGAWVKIDEHQCKRAFRLFINWLNQAVYGNAVRRRNKRLRVLPVLEKGEVRSRALRPFERRPFFVQVQPMARPRGAYSSERCQRTIKLVH